MKIRLAWFGHLSKMSDNRQVKKAWTTETGRQVKQKRSQKTWIDVVSQAI